MSANIEIDWDTTRLAYFTIGRNPRYGVTWLRRGVDAVESVEVAQTYDHVETGEAYLWLGGAYGYFVPASKVLGPWSEDDVLAPVDIMPEWDERWAVDTACRLVHATIVVDSDEDDA